MPRRLLAIFAHPDDESFGPGGTLAKYAREGVEVHVCTVTDGAAGSYDPALLEAAGVPDLASLRRRELECACQVLGARLHLLGYRDSGMEGSPDNAHPDSLYKAPLERVVRDLVAVIRRIRPHVVITHDPTGWYFHPDHIKVHRAVQVAFGRAGDPRFDVGGLPPWTPQRLYFPVTPRSSLRLWLWILRLQGKDPRRYGRNGDIDLTRVGVPDNWVHVRLDVGPYLKIKEAAGACHRSQGGGTRRWMPRWLRRRSLRFEHFTQAYPQPPRRHRDLFEGVREEGPEPVPMALAEGREG